MLEPDRIRLCVITDARLSRGRSHEAVARAAVEGGADMIQLRDKSLDARRLFEVAVALRRITRAGGALLIVNDRPDVAEAADADGVHLGQDDLPCSAARAFLGPGRVIGISAETPEQATEARRAGADYLGVGPVFEARGTKADAGRPVGTDRIRELCACCTLPILGVGGITAARVGDVLDAGASGVAVISAAVGEEDVAMATRRLREAVVGAVVRGRS